MPTSVKGGVELRKALRNFTPDLAKETTKEIASFLKPVVRDARGFMPAESPLSGWAARSFNEGKFPTYNGTIAKRGIKYKTSPSRANRRGFRSLVSILNTSAAGAIYETAGRKNAGGKFSPKLGGQITGSTQKMQGRAMFRAWDQDQGKAKNAVIKAIFNAADKFNKTAKVR
jgi:hypothetical protein